LRLHQGNEPVAPFSHLALEQQKPVLEVSHLLDPGVRDRGLETVGLNDWSGDDGRRHEDTAVTRVSG
jgi:hypothetical protein